MNTWKIPLSDVDFDNQEKEAVLDVLNSGWLTMGSVTSEFENKFSEFIGVNHSFAVANCTVALHLACVALGIGPGDEVILPSLTFVATANAVLYTGATPIFADVISTSDFTISLDSIKKLLNHRTKAIIVMHYGGYPCHMNEILQFAKENKLFIIEDAAHAPGASLDDIFLGGWGDLGCFSFFSNKNMTTGEGGMVTTNNPELAEKIKKLRSHGMTTLTWDRHQGHAWSYDVVLPGYNYRIDEIRSALGIVQLRKLSGNNQRRENVVNDYRYQLSQIVPEIDIPFLNHFGHSSFHLMPVLLPENIDRLNFMDRMKSQGIQTSIHYPPIHMFSYYKQYLMDKKFNLTTTEYIAQHVVTLPLYPGLSTENVTQIVLSVKNSF